MRIYFAFYSLIRKFAAKYTNSYEETNLYLILFGSGALRMGTGAALQRYR